MAAASGYQASKAINPQSYYVRRPYMSGYGYGRYGFRSPTAGAFEGGQQFGNELVQGIGRILQARQQQAQQAKMDAVANQLINQQLNTQNAPRAALAGQGTLSDAAYQKLRESNVNFQGTAPQTGLGGGTAELALRQQFAQQQLANQINQAKLEGMLRTLNAPPGVAGPATPAMTPYQQKQMELRQRELEQKQQDAKEKQFQSWQEKNALDAPKLAQNFDKTYGKGSAENFYNALTAGTGVRGNIVNGQFIKDDNGEYYSYDGDKAAGSAGFLGGLGAHPANVGDLEGTLIKYKDLQSYMDKAQQIEDAGGKLYPTEYPKELYGAAPKAQAVAQPAGPGDQTDQSDQGVDTSGDIFGPGGAADVTQTTPVDLSSFSSNAEAQPYYDAIPSGQQFVDLDGITKTKN